MARPRKYQTEQERQEARRTAGRNRGARFRAKQRQRVADIIALANDYELPSKYDDQPPPASNDDVELATYDE